MIDIRRVIVKFVERALTVVCFAATFLLLVVVILPAIFRYDLQADVIRLAIGNRPVIANVTFAQPKPGYGLYIDQSAVGLLAYDFNSVGGLVIRGNANSELDNVMIMGGNVAVADKSQEVKNYKLLCPLKPAEEFEKCYNNIWIMRDGVRQ